MALPLLSPSPLPSVSASSSSPSFINCKLLKSNIIGGGFLQNNVNYPLRLVLLQKQQQQKKKGSSYSYACECRKKEEEEDVIDDELRLDVGSPIIIVDVPAAVKTADPIPRLKLNNGFVKQGDVGRIVGRKPKGVWAVRLSAGTFLIDGKYFKPLDVDE